MSSDNTKKVVAREFLVFVSILCATLLGALSVYNWTITKLIDGYDHKLSEIDSKTQDWNYSNLKREAGIQSLYKYYGRWMWKHKKEKHHKNYNAFRDELWRIDRSDSTAHFWNNKWKDQGYLDCYKDFGIYSQSQFTSFVSKSYPTGDDAIAITEMDSLKKIQHDLRDSRTRLYRWMIYPHELSHEIPYYTFIVLLGLVFPLRYLYYAIRWSLRTLKS